MDTKFLLEQIESNLSTILMQETPEAQQLWNHFLELHPADSADFIADLDKEDAKKIIMALPKKNKLAIFENFSDTMKVFTLSIVDDRDKVMILNNSPIDKLTDLFDSLSNQELKEYLLFLNAHDRQKVLSLLEFDPESVGGIMDTDVVTLRQDFTVEKSIHVLQRLKPRLELHQQIYIIDQENKLIGHIRLEDLVLRSPSTRLNTLLRKNELVAHVNEDQESIAKKMIHYNLMTVPVVGHNNYFLGVIPTETLVNIIEQEASEDVYRMSAMTPITNTYFETPFFRIFYERSYILILLLLAQSISTIIIKRYEATLEGFFIFFITMLTSTGGNTSSQTSALVIQGMASGEITESNTQKFLLRELRMAAMLAFILGIFSFLRVYITYGQLLKSFAVSISLFVIVLVSVILGSCIPIGLKRLNIDPAFAAGPFLATIMDIIGLIIYCSICKLIFP